MSEPFAQPVNPLQQAQERQKKERNAIAQKESQLILDVFNGPHGEALISLWDEVYLQQPVALPDKDGEMNQFYTSQREGRNEFIRAIKRVIKTARSNADGSSTNNAGSTD